MTYALTVYCYLGPKLRLVVRKCPALLGVESLEARWRSSSKNISLVKYHSDGKYSGLLPLVTLALSELEEIFQWLLSQLLRYSFCGTCWNELEGLAIITQGKKSLFPHLPALHHLFCYLLCWCGDPQKEHTGFVCTGLTVARNRLRVMNRQSGDK